MSGYFLSASDNKPDYYAYKKHSSFLLILVNRNFGLLFLPIVCECGYMLFTVVHKPDNLFARNSKTMVVYAALCRSMSYRSDTFSMRIFLISGVNSFSQPFTVDIVDI